MSINLERGSPSSAKIVNVMTISSPSVSHMEPGPPYTLMSVEVISRRFNISTIFLSSSVVSSRAGILGEPGPADTGSVLLEPQLMMSRSRPRAEAARSIFFIASP